MKTAFHGDAEPVKSLPVPRRRYQCLAHGCPLPGSIFLSGHDAPGICALHMSCNSSDMPRITDVLRNWECVTFVHETCRQFLNDPGRCGDVKAERTLLAAQWTELARMAPDWPQLKPHGSTLGEWARQLLHFLVWRVNHDVHHRDVAWEWPPRPSRAVADMLTRVRGSIGNAGAAL